MYRLNLTKHNMSEFYAIETPPPSSSTSKDSLDESSTLFQNKKRMKLIGQISNCKTDEVREIFSIYLDDDVRQI